MSIRRIFLRRDTAANFASTNPVLSEGEPAFDTTNQILKVGDGVTAWNSLSQFQGPQGVAGNNGADGVAGQDGINILSYTTSNLPSGSPQGTMAFNTTLGKLVYYKNTAWYTFDTNTLVTGNTPKVMCVGDSITVGYTDNPSWTLPFRHGYREGIFNRMGTSIDFVGGSNEPTSTGTPDTVPALTGTADPLISSSSVLELYVGATFVDPNGTVWEVTIKNSPTNYVVQDNENQNTYIYDTSDVSNILFKHLNGSLIVTGVWSDTNKTVTYYNPSGVQNGIVWTYQSTSTQVLNLYANNFFVDANGVSYSITNVGSSNSYTLTKNEDGTEYPLSISATSIDFNNGAKTGTWNDTDKQMEFTDSTIWKYQLWNAIATAGQGGHRGYGGKTISYIRDNVASYISTDNPDIILLLIGINGGTTAELDTLVSNIFTAKPGVKLIVAELTPKSTPDASLTVLNNYITGTLVPAYKNQGRIIESVDLYSMFLDSNGDIDSTKLSNGINHPTNIMYDQMAKKWVETINSVLY